MSLQKLGRYDLIRVIGKGAMGLVYEARDPNLDRRVAIKTIKVENLSETAAAEYEVRFRTEAHSAARLQHPNIVSVYDSDRDGDIAYLVMEFILGQDLKHHLDKGMLYSLEQSLAIVRDLLSALDYAHQQNIVHRDVKPANLLIELSGRVKLVDFGVARIQDSGESTRTQGSMVGTLKYMSPEQVQGLTIDHRADLFSVGIVLYQLLTGHRPFDGENDFSIIHQIINHVPERPSSFNAKLPEAIDAVVFKALAKAPNDRFATARDFAVALQAAMRRAADPTILPPVRAQRAPAPARFSLDGSGATSISTITQEVELVYWKDVRESSDMEDLEVFLVKFPSGIYADLARRRLRRLAGGTTGDDTDLRGITSIRAAAAGEGAAGARPNAGLESPEQAAAPAPESLPFAAAALAAPLAAPPFQTSSAYDATMLLDDPDVTRQGFMPSAPAEVGAETTLTMTRPLLRAPRQSEPVHNFVKEPVAQFAHAERQSSLPAAVMARSGETSAPSSLAATAALDSGRTGLKLGWLGWVLAGLAVLVTAGMLLTLLFSQAPAEPEVALVLPAAPEAVVPAEPLSAPQVVLPLAAPPAVFPAKASAAPAAQKSAAPGADRVPAEPGPASADKPALQANKPALANPDKAEAASSRAPGAVVVAVAANPKQACEGRLLLGFQICMAEQCDKPAFKSHAVCIERRDMEQSRERQRITN